MATDMNEQVARRSEENWAGFTKFATVGTAAVVLLLVVMALTLL